MYNVHVHIAYVTLRRDVHIALFTYCFNCILSTMGSLLSIGADCLGYLLS